MSQTKKIQEALSLLNQEYELRDMLSYLKEDLDIAIAMAILDPFDQFAHLRSTWAEYLKILCRIKSTFANLEHLNSSEDEVKKIEQQYASTEQLLIQSVTQAVESTEPSDEIEEWS